MVVTSKSWQMSGPDVVRGGGVESSPRSMRGNGSLAVVVVFWALGL